MFQILGLMVKSDCYLNYQVRRFLTSKSQQNWTSVVGLEVHAQINSFSKLFSGSSTTFSSSVNTNVSLFDCSIPGTLPVLNEKCVELGVLTALALNCHINPISMFDRKHYFYADIPTGYQITQQRYPLANNGKLEFQVFTPGIHKNPYKTQVRIKQIQLEQDSGKSLHDSHRSLVDLNRAGIPLMELVFEPDLQDGEEAAALIKELITILQRIGTCSCKMEEGALRVDANVSIHQKDTPFGVRSEIKNIGSVRGVASAIKYEIERQIEVVEGGGQVENETRAWDAVNKRTIGMRDKERLQDYRYMPEPNLPPLHVAMGLITQGCVNVDELKKKIPELPEETRTRLKEKFGLTLEQCIILVNETQLLDLFEQTSYNQHLNGKLLANFLINDYLTLLHKMNLESSQIELKPNYLNQIIEFLQAGKINRKTSKLLLETLIQGSEKSPLEIIREQNLMQIIDEIELRKLCEEVVKQNTKIVNQYKSGKIKVFKALLGQVAVKSDQRADMAKCDKILKELLTK